MGLTNGEAKVYVALLVVGSSTVGPIIKRSGIAHSNIYEILERLTSKGLVSYTVVERTKYYHSTSPSRILEFIDQQDKKIQQSRATYESILPQLNSLIKESKKGENAELFLGIKGVAAAYEVLLEEIIKGEEGRYFYIYNKERLDQASKVYGLVMPFFKKAGIKWRGVCDARYRGQREAAAWRGIIKNKYTEFPLPGNIDIYGDKINIVSWSSKPVAVIIRSREVADNLKRYFDAMWETASA